jgi:hypothetical protein
VGPWPPVVDARKHRHNRQRYTQPSPDEADFRPRRELAGGARVSSSAGTGPGPGARRSPRPISTGRVVSSCGLLCRDARGALVATYAANRRAFIRTADDPPSGPDVNPVLICCGTETILSYCYLQSALHLARLERFDPSFRYIEGPQLHLIVWILTHSAPAGRTRAPVPPREGQVAANTAGLAQLGLPNWALPTVRAKPRSRSH